MSMKCGEKAFSSVNQPEGNIGPTYISTRGRSSEIAIKIIAKRILYNNTLHHYNIQHLLSNHQVHQNKIRKHVQL